MPPDANGLPVLTPYELLGGEPVLQRLTERFYELMDQLPEAAGIRRMHPRDLARSQEKLFMFLSGWLGGPGLFVERYGDPRLRARHLPFAIGSGERDAWLLCMQRAADEIIVEPSLRAALMEALSGLADHMRNRHDLA